MQALILKKTHFFATQVPTLQVLAQRVIIDNRQVLGDVGDVPQNLIESVLGLLSPEQLRRVEKQTALSRRIEPLNCEKFWQTHCEKLLGLKGRGVVDGRTLTWRSTFKWQVKQEEHKKVELAKKMSSMYNKTKQERDSRTVKVLNYAAPVRRKNRAKGKYTRNDTSNHNYPSTNFKSRIGQTGRQKIISILKKLR